MKLTLPTATYDISPFPHPINTELSTYRVAPVKIEISLVKKDLGIKWSGLTGAGEGDGGELHAARGMLSGFRRVGCPTPADSRSRFGGMGRIRCSEGIDGGCSACCEEAEEGLEQVGG